MATIELSSDGSRPIDFTLEQAELVEKLRAKSFEEGKLRRDNELVIMLYECEGKGWTLTRFLNTFLGLIETKERKIKS